MLSSWKSEPLPKRSTFRWTPALRICMWMMPIMPIANRCLMVQPLLPCLLKLQMQYPKVLMESIALMIKTTSLIAQKSTVLYYLLTLEGLIYQQIYPILWLPAKDHRILKILQSDSLCLLGDAFLVDTYVVYDLENHEVSIAQASFNDQEEDIELFSDSVPGAIPAPGYSSTWVYTPGSPIGTGDFYNVDWTSYSGFSQYESSLATVTPSDAISSFPSAGSSSETSTKKKNSGYRCCRSSFSFSLLPFLSCLLL